MRARFFRDFDGVRNYIISREKDGTCEWTTDKELARIFCASSDMEFVLIGCSIECFIEIIVIQYRIFQIHDQASYYLLKTNKETGECTFGSKQKDAIVFEATDIEEALMKALSMEGDIEVIGSFTVGGEVLDKPRETGAPIPLTIMKQYIEQLYARLLIYNETDGMAAKCEELMLVTGELQEMCYEEAAKDAGK